MKKELFLISGLLLCFQTAYGFDMVLPENKNYDTTDEYAFFVGSTNNSEDIYINGQKIFTASNGAFAHTCKLKEGENRIMLKSGLSTRIYKINKKIAQTEDTVLVEFDNKKAVVKNDNTPLRSTPIDFGMNRISHLFQNTELIINGEQGDFYRVYLSKDKYGWIAKKDTDLDCKGTFEGAKFINMENKKFKNASVQTIEFSKNLPYTVEEREKDILFRVYNPELSENSVYDIVLNKPSKYFYKTTLENGKYTFKVTSLPDSISECIIAVDAGHGGSEKGAKGCLGDEEKNINLKIARELKEILTNAGAKVVMTRDRDKDVSIPDRVKTAQEQDVNIFVSIHLNSIPDIPFDVHKNRGTSVYYYNYNSKNLANSVEKHLTKSAGTRNDKVRTASFGVIRPTEYVGILVETAYMTNPLDSVLYRDKNFPEKTAKGIAEGIFEFINSKN